MSKTQKAKEKVIGVGIALIAFVAFMAIGVYGNFTYARRLAVRGVVEGIQWKTDNHGLPKFVIKTDSGKEVSLSQFTIMLVPSEIKAGDRIAKESGTKYCTVNGRQIPFARY